MEIIFIILSIAIFLMISPYITYIVNLIGGVVPDVIMTFLLVAIGIKTILFIIHRGSEG